MKSNLYLELTDRTKQIFKTVVESYLEAGGVRVEKKQKLEREDTITLDFATTNPKIMTYHSAKGLQFNDVFLPFCEKSNLNAKGDDFYKKPLYVAITRTLNNLYITYSDELTDYLENISYEDQ